MIQHLAIAVISRVKQNYEKDFVSKNVDQLFLSVDFKLPN